MKIICEIEETEIENDTGRMVEGVVAICSECDHMVESFGTGQPSINRCLVLMNKECPQGENNFYVQE